MIDIKKHVAFFLESLDLGGIGRLTLRLAEGFAQKGYSVDLVLAKKQGDYLDQVPRGVNLVDLGSSRIVFSLPRLGAYLGRAKPDLLISAKERVNIIALLAKMIYKPDTRVIISIHVNHSEQIRHQGVSLHYRLVLKAAKLLYSRADRVVAVSRGVAADAASLFGVPEKEIAVIYNPLVTPALKEKMRDKAEHPWFEEEGLTVILGIGRLVRQKDFLTLINSFARVKQDKPGARLMILGEGEQRKALENKIAELGYEEAVALPGYVDNPYSYLARSALFVLSSAWEGFGNVLVEAMATGTPVVSTDCPSGPAEILAGGKYGVLVPVGDPDRMAEGIIAALEQPVSKECLQKRAETFSVDRILKDYESLL